MAKLSYVNIFSKDIDGLSKFYADLFTLEEIVESRSALFRGFQGGGCGLGFNAPGAYELLGVEPSQLPGGPVFLTFDVANSLEVDALTTLAVEKGATLLKAPFKTYYGWYQSVLRDPERNVFRINCTN